MACKTTVVVALLAVVVAVHAAVPTASSGSTTAAVNRGRGAKRMFVSRPRPRALQAPAPTPTPRAITSRSSTPPATPTYTPSSFPPTSAAPPESSFSPTPRHSVPTVPTPVPQTFAPTPFPTPFPQSQTVVRIPGPSPTPRFNAPQDVFVAPRRASAPLAFSPRALAQAPQHLAQAPQHLAQAPFPRPRGTAVPIVALKFHLNEDGTYSTSSETGDGTVRQEQGIFNGAGMAVKGMYAYRDLDVGPVQVNYVADEYGFQPQGPNIHPAILQAVAEQVNAARTAKASAKSRLGAAGLNGLDNDGELDYDEDNGAGTSPAPIKFKSRAVRRVVVRRL